MRYTKAREEEVKALAESGKSLDFIASVTGLPKKVIWQWCPVLRPHEDIIKQSVKQRFHFIYPDFEAKISNAFSPFVRSDISEDDWEEINKVIYKTLYEESLYVFKNAITDPPDFSDIKKLSNDLFLDYLKKFWTTESDYVKEKKCKESYVKSNFDSIHYWSMLKFKMLKDVTKNDIEIIHSKLSEKNLSSSRIYQILQVGLIPLKYAYNNGLTLLKAFDYKLPRKCEMKREKLAANVLLQILNSKWENLESQTANYIGYYAKMQLREVRALTFQDIYPDGYISASHIFERNEYKENPNARIIKVPTSLINWIFKYASKSPYKDYKSTDFIFFSSNRNQPANGNLWSKDLKLICSNFMEDVSHIEFSIWA